MKHPLKRFTIAITGDFGETRTHEKIKQWIEANGGTFAPKISVEVTHLVCSKEHYKKLVTMVQQARKIKGLKIVTFDWLEDSLMKGSRKLEKPYLLGRQVKVDAKAKAEKKVVRKENIQQGLEIFEKSCRDFQDAMHSDGYHIYRDRTNFIYDITLAHIDLLTNKNERYSLKLHESHTLPHLYATYIRYSAPGSQITQVLAPLGSAFETAMDAFRHFFKIKTRREWEERKAWGGVDGCFVYTAPKAGEPVGVGLDEVKVGTGYGFGELEASEFEAGVYEAAMVPDRRFDGGAFEGGMDGLVASASAHLGIDI